MDRSCRSFKLLLLLVHLKFFIIIWYKFFIAFTLHQLQLEWRLTVFPTGGWCWFVNWRICFVTFPTKAAWGWFAIACFEAILRKIYNYVQFGLQTHSWLDSQAFVTLWAETAWVEFGAGLVIVLDHTEYFIRFGDEFAAEEGSVLLHKQLLKISLCLFLILILLALGWLNCLHLTCIFI